MKVLGKKIEKYFHERQAWCIFVSKQFLGSPAGLGEEEILHAYKETKDRKRVWDCDK